MALSTSPVALKTFASENWGPASAGFPRAHASAIPRARVKSLPCMARPNRGPTFDGVNNGSSTPPDRISRIRSRAESYAPRSSISSNCLSRATNASARADASAARTESPRRAYVSPSRSHPAADAGKSRVLSSRTAIACSPRPMRR